MYIAHGLWPHGGLYGGSDPIGWVGRYGPDGDLLDTLADGLDHPSGLAADDSVLHVLHRRGVTSYALPGGGVSGQVEVRPPVDGPRAICMAPAGTLFVAETGGRVSRLDPRVGIRSAVPICELPDVTALAFDREAGTLYLATGGSDAAPGRLWVLGPDDDGPRLLGSARADFASLVYRGGILYACTVNASPSDPLAANGEGVLAVGLDGVLLGAIPYADSIVTPGQVEVLGGDLLFVPESHTGRVVITRLPTPEL